MNDLERQHERIILIAQDRNERALVASQLQEELDCQVDGAASVEDAIALLIVRATLIVLDWSDQSISPEIWSGFRAAARGAPILVLARRLASQEFSKFGIDAAHILFRPFTVGDVVRHACELMRKE